MRFRRYHQLALACALLIASHAFATTAQIEFGPVCGSVGTNSATFTLGVTEAGTKARLLVSTNENWETPVATAWPTVTEGARKFTVQGLQPATKYFYAVELDGRRQKEAAGQFRTLPVGPASFQFAFGNSLRSHRPANSGLTAATQHDILFFLNTGDLFNKDIAVNDHDRISPQACDNLQNCV
jgi:phosphodiesterase/alkaline phosphatase D-like protein